MTVFKVAQTGVRSSNQSPHLQFEHVIYHSTDQIERFTLHCIVNTNVRVDALHHHSLVKMRSAYDAVRLAHQSCDTRNRTCCSLFHYDVAVDFHFVYISEEDVYAILP